MSNLHKYYKLDKILYLYHGTRASNGSARIIVHKYKNLKLILFFILHMQHSLSLFSWQGNLTNKILLKL